jgi:hypothetical protein
MDTPASPGPPSGQQAFLDFLGTRAGKEWLQLGCNAFLSSVQVAGEAEQTDIPARVDVKTT